MDAIDRKIARTGPRNIALVDLLHGSISTSSMKKNTTNNRPSAVRRP